MRSRTYTVTAAVLTSLVYGIAAGKEMAGPTGAAPVDTYSEVAQLFSNPPVEFRPAPLWAWNADITEAEILAHLKQSHEMGIGGVFIHPRPGLITEYLSDRWFSLCRYTLDEAKKLGMQVWIYDEDSYPSGFAGGHVPAEMPESYRDGQGLLLHRLSRLTPGDARKCRILQRRSGDQFQDVSGAAPGGDEPGEYYCFEVVRYEDRAWNGGYSYVDLLRPGVTEKFIQVTMPGYERALGSEFGKAVPGSFSDEPRIIPPIRKNCIRWTPDLFRQFERRWGYDLKPHLASLLDETGDWRRIRHNYQALLLELFIEHWSKPMFRYTEAQHLQWTGHYWEHEWPNPTNGPDNMAMYAWHQLPGIDMLLNQFREDVNAQFGNVRSVKELSSVANQLGRRRALSESYAGGGWELRFEDMKRLGDWEFALGVNFLNLHLMYYTLAGARKYDFPPSFTYHEPWRKDYRPLADYFARLSLALSAGKQVNDILVIEPTTSAWMYAVSATANAGIMVVGNAFQEFVTRLEAMQGEYDLGSENILKDHGRTARGHLVVGQREYKLVVLPPGLETLDTHTVDLLAAYLDQGGKVVSFVDAPQRVDGAESQRVKQLSHRYPARWLRVASLDEPQARALLLRADFAQVSGKLFHHRRQLKDGQLLFFVNSRLDQPAHAVVGAAGAAVIRLDPLSAAVSAYPVEKSGTALSLTVDLPPGGSLLLAVLNKDVPAPPSPHVSLDERVLSTTGTLSVPRPAKNALRIDYCDLKMGGAIEKDIFHYVASEKIFRHHGLPTNPWNSAVQYRTRIVDKDHFPAGSGFEAIFFFDVAAGVNVSGFQAVVERPALWQVLVNGTAVRNREGDWWLDHAFGVYDIGRHVTIGRNALTILANPMRINAELEPVYILGDFGVESQSKGWRVTPPGGMSVGSWKDHGLPFFCDRVAYSAGYRITRGRNRYKVRLGKWNGTVAEVTVNGKPAGIIGWQPYELDITDSVQDGGNRIEVIVCGSLKNLLGPHHGKIDRGYVSPLSFRSAPSHTPPGSLYDLDAYGLFEGFQLIESKESQ